MPKYSVSSMFFHEYEINKIFNYVSRAGCTSIEFWLETPNFWLNGLPVEKLLNVINHYKALTPITVHSPVLDLNPCSVNPDISEASINSAEKAVRMAEELNAQIITIHPGRRTAKRAPGIRDIERLNNYLERIRIAQEKRKIIVAIENMQPKINALLSTPDSVFELLEREKWLYFTFDIAHSIHNPQRDSFRYIDLLYDRIKNIHVSGINGNKTHTTPKGDKKVKELLLYLSDCGYNGHLTLEIEDLNFGSKLGPIEKVRILEDEINFIKEIFDK